MVFETAQTQTKRGIAPALSTISARQGQERKRRGIARDVLTPALQISRCGCFHLWLYRLQQLTQRTHVVECLIHELSLITILGKSQVGVPCLRRAFQLTGTNRRETKMVMSLGVQRIESDGARECFRRGAHTALRRQCAT